MLPFVIDASIQDLVDKRVGYRRESLKVVSFLSKKKIAELVESRKGSFGLPRNAKIREEDGYEVWQFSLEGVEQRLYACAIHLFRSI